MKGAILVTVRGDCRKRECGGGEEDIEELGRRPEAEAELCIGFWRRASKLPGRTVRPCVRGSPLLKGELHPRIVRGCVDGKRSVLNWCCGVSELTHAKEVLIAALA